MSLCWTSVRDERAYDSVLTLRCLANVHSGAVGHSARPADYVDRWDARAWIVLVQDGTTGKPVATERVVFNCRGDDWKYSAFISTVAESDRVRWVEGSRTAVHPDYQGRRLGAQLAAALYALTARGGRRSITGCCGVELLNWWRPFGYVDTGIRLEPDGCTRSTIQAVVQAHLADDPSVPPTLGAPRFHPVYREIWAAIASLPVPASVLERTE